MKVAFVVHAQEIAGAHPAQSGFLDEGALVFLRLIPVAEHHARAGEHQLAGGARRDELERQRIEDRRVHVRHRAAERAGLWPLYRIDMARSCGLRQAITREGLRAGPPPPSLRWPRLRGVGATDD